MILEKIIKLIIFICAAPLAHMQTNNNDMQLMLVQMLYRHGARAPVDLYPTDPNPKSAFPNGLGKLTQLGKRQHYLLGLKLRSMYSNFYTTAPTEVNVTSADCDRCLTSAESNLAAFFAPTDEWKLFSNLKWQPIVIHYIPDKEDKYFSLDNKCPKAQASEKKVFKEENDKIMAEHKDMFPYLTEKSGKKISDPKSAVKLFDTFQAEENHNLAVPDWINPYYGVLQNITSKLYAWGFNTPTIKRLKGGPLLKLMINNMIDKINGSLPDIKFEVYSAHDVNVALLLECLNFRVTDTIPFAATVILELYSAPDYTYYVRALFLNTTSNDKYNQEPHVLYLKDCDEFCPLLQFIEDSQQYIPEDWDKECEL